MRSRPVSRGQPLLLPCIAELLRTCVYPPTLVLRVEKILEETKQSRCDEDETESVIVGDGKSHCKRTYRLYLGDGVIMIQALLAPHLHPLIDLQETTEGSLVELRDYAILRARRLDGNGKVVYLGVEDYVCISLSRPTTSEAHQDVLVNGGGFMIEEEQCIAPQRVSSHIQVPSSPPPQDMPQESTSSQESCAYETVTIDLETVKKRRRALHEMSRNTRQKRDHEDEENGTPRKQPRLDIQEPAFSQETDLPETAEVSSVIAKKRRLILHKISTNTHQQKERIKLDEGTPTIHSPYIAVADDRVAKGPHLDEPANTVSDAADFATRVISDPAAPLHTLSSLLHPTIPLPTKNYAVTILAVISWISPTLVYRPGSPFPPKRTLKLHDPSITNKQVGVAISVFIDASTFTPRHSTIALFRGVVMQMYGDEVILNAYHSLRDTEWYVDDEDKLENMGYDVRGLRDWWEERKIARAFTRPGSAGNAFTRMVGVGRFPEHAGAIVTKE